VVEPHTEGCWEHENAYMDSSSMYLRCINIALTFGLRVSPYGVAFTPHHTRQLRPRVVNTHTHTRTHTHDTQYLALKHVLDLLVKKLQQLEVDVAVGQIGHITLSDEREVLQQQSCWHVLNCQQSSD